MAIVGHGYVGKAVDHGFVGDDVVKYIIDPIYNVGMESIEDVDIDVAFVCVPTPFGANGEINSSIVESVVAQLESKNCLIVIKSTVTPDIVGRLANNPNVVYNPEFLTERNALDDFIKPPMHIFGGAKDSTYKLEKIYQDFSRCGSCKVFHMSAMEASFAKYGINSFLATKVLWMNQFKDIVDNSGCDYSTIISAIGTDRRIGFSHAQVPGPDGRKGYGGACFPKDTNAFATFAKGGFTVLNEVISKNNEYRAQYELDDREKEQNVVYNKQ